jgi:spore coat polysaccharide biosynthesis predicted glycosyltransferase SpsG
MAEPPPPFVRRAQDEGARVEVLGVAPGGAADAAATAALARAEGAAWVVLDGYGFGGDFQQALRDAGARVLALDDYGHADRYPADLGLNQNLGAEAARYAVRSPDTRLALGPRHALLRREFRTWAGGARTVPDVARRVLVSLGGSDPDDVSSRVVRALGRVRRPLELQVLAGAANPHRAALERAAAASPHPVELAVDVRDMPRRLAWADLAVAAAGGTSWELARVGTPQVAVVLAENQRPAGLALAEHGLAVGLGWHGDLTDAAIAAAVDALAGDRVRRAELARRGAELVDGQGALRLLAAMGLLSPAPVPA